jgi:hypothetical protein
MPDQISQTTAKTKKLNHVRTYLFSEGDEKHKSTQTNSFNSDDPIQARQAEHLGEENQTTNKI